MATTTETDSPEILVHDDYIDGAEAAELEHGSAARSLFDLRTIIGAAFTVYGIYLTISVIFAGPAPTHKAAGVRINLWTGLGMLALGIAFLTWVKLRPLTVDELLEDDTEAEDCGDVMRREPKAAGAPHGEAARRCRERSPAGTRASGEWRSGLAAPEHRS